MIVPTRLQERMEAREISQSELARRVGVTQATIYRLVAGKAYGTTHIHKIARELDTSPAYLNGETDYPAADAPTGPALSPSAIELVKCFDRLSARDRTALLTVARAMCRECDDATLHEGGAVYRVEDRHQQPRLQEPRRAYEVRRGDEIEREGEK